VFTTDGVSAGEFEERATLIDQQAGCSRAKTVTTLETALQEWADTDDGAWIDKKFERARERGERKYTPDAWNRDWEDPS